MRRLTTRRGIPKLPALGALGRVYYGWWMLLGGALGLMTVSAVYYFGAGAFFLPIANEFGASRAALSGAFSLARVETSVTGPFQGMLIDRFGPRPVMLFGFAGMGAGFFLLSRASSLLWFYVIFIGLVALGDAFGLSTTPMVIVNNWFRRRKGLASGLIYAGTSVGSAFVPLIAIGITTFGWRTACVLIGFASLAICIPASAIIRRRPEDYGWLPDGDKAPPASQGVAPVAVSAADEGFTFREAIHTSTFWLIAFAFVSRQLMFTVVTVHFIPNLVDRGYTLAQAAFYLSVAGFVGIVGRIGIGYLGDYWDKRYVMAVAAVCMGGSLLLASVAQSPWEVILFALLYGPADGGMVSMYISIRGEYFGRRAFGAISGFSSSIIMIGSITGPIVAGYIFDVTGSYSIAFASMGCSGVLGALLILLAKRPALPQRATQGG